MTSALMDKPKPPKEEVLLKHVKQLLQLHENSGDLYWDRANSGERNSSGMVYSKRQGRMVYRKSHVQLLRPGTSDIIVWLPGGRIVFVELKRVGEKQSEDQLKFEATMKRLGFDYHVVYDLHTFYAILQTYGVPKRMEFMA